MYTIFLKNYENQTHGLRVSDKGLWTRKRKPQGDEWLPVSYSVCQIAPVAPL